MRKSTRRTFGVILVAAACFALAPASLTALTPQQANTFAQVVAKVLREPNCPVLSDPAGNAAGNPVDFTRLYVSNDAANVYFLVEFAGDASRNVSSHIDLNTDLDQTTGCQSGVARLNGSEYGVFLHSPSFSPSFVGLYATDCSSGSDTLPNRGGLRTAIQGRYIAAVVPIATLRTLAPDVGGFLVTFNGGGNFGPAAYKFR